MTSRDTPQRGAQTQAEGEYGAKLATRTATAFSTAATS